LTERQKRYRQRRAVIVQSVTAYKGKAVYAYMGSEPKAAAEITLSTLMALTQSSKCEMEESITTDDRVLLTIKAGTLLPEVQEALGRQPFDEWVSEEVRTLWDEGYPVEFQISIMAVVDKRKKNSMEKRLAKEEAADHKRRFAKD
jgi:hypothetical protein